MAQRASIPQLRLLIAWVVLGVWVCSFLGDIFIREYDPPPEINGLLLIVVTAAFGTGHQQGGTHP